MPAFAMASEVRRISGLLEWNKTLMLRLSGQFRRFRATASASRSTAVWVEDHF